MKTIEMIGWIRCLTGYFNFPATCDIQRKSEALRNSEKADEIVESLKRGEKIEKGLIQFLKKGNPYPEDVFLIIKKEDLNKINNFFKKELGYPMDRLSGNMGRRIYKSITEVLREIIK